MLRIVLNQKIKYDLPVNQEQTETGEEPVKLRADLCHKVLICGLMKSYLVDHDIIAIK